MPRLRRQALGPVLLVGLLDLVEVASADAGTIAGEADVVEFLGQSRKPEPGLDKLFSRPHEAVSSFGWSESGETPNLPLARCLGYRNRVTRVSAELPLSLRHVSCLAPTNDSSRRTLSSR